MPGTVTSLYYYIILYNVMLCYIALHYFVLAFHCLPPGHPQTDFKQVGCVP